jgi:hypothetical protein
MGFSLTGTIIVAVILAPNLLMLLAPPKNMPEGMKDKGAIFTVLECIGQAGCFVLPVISKGWFEGRGANVWFILAALCAAAYWCLWIRYAVRRDFALLFSPLWFIPLPMAVFPVLAFALLAVWGAHVWLGAAAALLAAGHFVNSWHTYTLIKSKLF